MSYSFNVKAATKAAARAAVAKKFDEEVVKHQPSHKRDRDSVMANLDASLALLADDDSRDVVVMMSGSLALENWDHQETCGITGVTLNCSVGYANRG